MSDTLVLTGKEIAGLVSPERMLQAPREGLVGGRLCTVRTGIVKSRWNSRAASS